jgi:hypothetical protein
MRLIRQTDRYGEANRSIFVSLVAKAPKILFCRDQGKRLSKSGSPRSSRGISCCSNEALHRQYNLCLSFTDTDRPVDHYFILFLCVF